MPIYEYRCAECGALTSALRPVAEARADVECEACGGVARRIVSRSSVHLSRLSKVEKLDPKYDKMVDQAMRRTSGADPDRLLGKMKPFDKGSD